MEWAVMIPELRAVIRNAAKHMTGFKRRRFMAAMAMEHCNGSPRQTETSLGFNRRAVSRGLQELELGKTIRNLPERRGRPRIEQQRLMNRRGFSLRKVRKTQPLKKIPETHDIFDNVKAAHQRAATVQSILRISIDDKAKVKIGDFSRGGYTRCSCDVAVHDKPTTPSSQPDCLITRALVLPTVLLRSKIASCRQIAVAG